jgi:hypothetical protein
VESIVNQAYLKYKLVCCFNDLSIGNIVDLKQTPNHMSAKNMHAEYEFKFDTNNNEYNYGNIDANKLHHVKLITHVELFTEVSHDNCLCYIMLGKHIELHQMLEKVYEITSMNSAYICISTFNLVRDHVDSNFYVYVICITCENFVQLKLNNRYVDQSNFHHVLINFSLNGALLETKSYVLDHAQIDSTSWSSRSFSPTL